MGKTDASDSRLGHGRARVAEDAELVFVPLDAVVAALRRHPDAALAAVASAA